MALDFNGTTAEVAHGDIAALDTPTAFTISFWLRYDTAVLNDPFVRKTSAATNGFSVRSHTASADFACWFGGGAQAVGRSVGALATGAWAHWAIVYDGGGAANADRLKIWKDGTAQTLTFTNTIPAAVGDSGIEPLRVMGDGGTAQSDGQVGHLCIWTAALTAAEVIQQRYMARPIRQANLLIWAPYDNIGGTGVTLDLSGNNHHGSVNSQVYAAGPLGATAPVLGPI